jgi:hypothetical protein
VIITRATEEKFKWYGWSLSSSNEIILERGLEFDRFEGKMQGQNIIYCV